MGKLLIITSSRKDVMVLISMGLSAISGQTEAHMIPEKILSKLKKRYKYIITFLDNDSTGINTASNYFSNYNYRSIHIPSNYGYKDISDFRERFGAKKTYKLVKKLIKDLYNTRKLPY